MFDDPRLVQFLIIVFAGTLTRATFGFGDALVSMPFLVLLFGWEIAAPLIALKSVVIAVIILSRDWKEVDFQSARWLILTAFVGIGFGLTIFRQLDKNWVLGLLGGMIVCTSAYALWQPKLVRLNNDRFAPAVGFIAGLLSGAYNTPGPPLVIYGAMRHWPAQKFRATMQAFFLPTSLLVVIGHGWAGRLTSELWEMFLLTLVVLPFALVLGRRINTRFRTESFAGILHGLLLGIGGLLIYRAITLSA
ncbi:MAG: sulfite exporter TauE/SafE family protein [Planctomycetaceae bacterium]